MTVADLRALHCSHRTAATVTVTVTVTVRSECEREREQQPEGWLLGKPLLLFLESCTFQLNCSFLPA
jgi:hypothetical protein